MVMHRLLALAALAVGVCVAIPAKADRSVITTSGEGHDLTVVVHDVTDYCSTNAHTEVIRRGDSIRIVRDRPTVVSRCLTQRDLTFVIKDLPTGTYTISYEQIPLVAPARFIKLASTTVNVRE
jgi:hypothetical protein